MNQDINRLLMELERKMREVNREVINAEFDALTVDGLRPVLCLVAKARARYLRALFDLGGQTGQDRASTTQIDQLAELRREFQELSEAAKALETALQRGYLDVQSAR